MKEVLGSCCDAVFIDIPPDVPRHDVRTGAYLIAAVAPTTPAGTVHPAVVDPGVGTARHPLIVTGGGQFFVGPDNGLLLPPAKRLGGPRGFQMNGPSIRGEKVSTTFHARDPFAPAAAPPAAGPAPPTHGR